MTEQTRRDVDSRKVRAAANAMVTVIEHLSRSNLRAASGDSLLMDAANNLRRRIVEDARRIGVEV